MDRVLELRAEFVDGFWATLYLMAGGLLVGGLVGLLVGVGLYTTRAGGIAPQRAVNVALNVLVNFFRPIPFILLAIALQPATRAIGIGGIGLNFALVAIVFASAFGIARIVEQNLFSVNPGVLEAARSMGASRFHVVRTVLLPEAFGPLVLGYAFALVAIVDMTAIVGVLGANSLGNVALTYGYRQYDYPVMVVAILLVIAIVQLGQLGGNLWARRIMRR